jgi:hypothetical protein
MANNIEWLKEHFLIVGSVARIDSKKVTISNDEYQHLELAITAKINEMQTESYKKGYIQRGLDELRKYENDKG